MEPLRLLFGLLFAMMSVGVLVLPVSWPFNKTNTAPTTSETQPMAEMDAEADTSLVKLAEIPTETILSIRPLNHAKDLEDQLSMAKFFSAEGDFDEALDVLSKVSVLDQDKYEVVFLRAQILSWAGRHQAADLKFQRLMTTYPGNTDVMLSYGYLQYYQGQTAEAEKTFLDVLDIFPNYQDAKDGLVKVRDAM